MPDFRRCPRQPLRALWLLAALLAAAAQAAGPNPPDDEDDEEAVDDSRWGLDLRTEVDQASGRSFSVRAGHDFTPNTRMSIAGTSVNSATSQSNLVSSGFDVGFAHDFKHFGADLGVGRWQDNGVVQARHVTAGVGYAGEAWSIGLDGQWRRSDFNAFEASTTVTLRNGTILPVRARAKCSLDDYGYGLHGGYSGEIWSLQASYLSYRYADTKCSFSARGLDALARAQRAEFRQLAAALTSQLERKIGTRIGSENALLDSSYGVGASWRRNDLVVALDFSRQKEIFQGLTSDTLAATATADFGNNTGVDVTLGATRSPKTTITAATATTPATTSGGTIAFVGFALRARF